MQKERSKPEIQVRVTTLTVVEGGGRGGRSSDKGNVQKICSTVFNVYVYFVKMFHNKCISMQSDLFFTQ